MNRWPSHAFLSSLFRCPPLPESRSRPTYYVTVELRSHRKIRPVGFVDPGFVFGQRPYIPRKISRDCRSASSTCFNRLKYTLPGERIKGESGGADCRPVGAGDRTADN